MTKQLLPDFKFCQSFGSDGVANPQDVISTIRFSPDNKFLAAGDCGGRVIMFNYRSKGEAPVPNKNGILQPSTSLQAVTEFNAHYCEYDYLRSADISAQIVDMQWLRPNSDTHFLLTANERDVQLFKIGEQNKAFQTFKTSHKGIQFPQKQQVESKYFCKPQRRYGNSTPLHLHSLSLLSSGDSFVVADDFSIRQFWVEDHTNGQLLFDFSPSSADAVINTLTAVRAHPQHDALLLAGFSASGCRVFDARASLKSTSQQFGELNAPVHDVQSTQNLIFCRHFDQLQVFDIRNLKQPMQKVAMNPRLGELQDPLSARRVIQNVDTYEVFGAHQAVFREPLMKFRISTRNSLWASGFRCDMLQVGDLDGNVVGWRCTRQIKRNKDATVPGWQIGSQQLIKPPQVLTGNYPVELGSSNNGVCSCDFSDDLIVCGLGVNLYVYGWLDPKSNQKK